MILTAGMFADPPRSQTLAARRTRAVRCVVGAGNPGVLITARGGARPRHGRSAGPILGLSKLYAAGR